MAILRERQSVLTHQFTDGLNLSVPKIEKLTRELANLREHAELLDNEANSD